MKKRVESLPKCCGAFGTVPVEVSGFPTSITSVLSCNKLMTEESLGGLFEFNLDIRATADIVYSVKCHILFCILVFIKSITTFYYFYHTEGTVKTSPCSCLAPEVIGDSLERVLGFPHIILFILTL